MRTASRSGIDFQSWCDHWTGSERNCFISRGWTDGSCCSAKVAADRSASGSGGYTTGRRSYRSTRATLAASSDLTGQHDLTRWIARTENCATAGLGLTFAYKPDDPICLKGMKDAIRQGIPLLVWCREDSDVNQLEGLLEKVRINDLLDEVYKWRCLTSGDGKSTRDARYHIVLLLDNPHDVRRPSEHLFAAPR